MRSVALASVLGIVAVVWGSAFLGWRWTRRRLGLAGPDASGMSERERSARRSLRALLAFNFLVMWPVGLPACIMAVIVAFEQRDLIGPSVAALLGLVCFTVAVPSLIRTARELERHRLSDEPDSVPPSLWLEGRLASLTAKSSRGARWGRYALVIGILVASVLNWGMTLAMVFCLSVAAALWLGWKLLTRRGQNHDAPTFKTK